MLTHNELNAICSDLEGTCKNLEDVVLEATGRELEDLTIGELQEIDNCVLCCDTCGWWVDAGCVDENGNCDDCQDYD